jgi:hypothetical protein
MLDALDKADLRRLLLKSTIRRSDQSIAAEPENDTVDRDRHDNQEL